MSEKDKNKTINVNVTELFGIQVLRKYEKTIGENEKLSDRGSRVLLGALTVMVLSTMICSGVMVAILYHPPPLVRELSESILMNFGQKSVSTSPEFVALQEQLRNANEKIEGLKKEAERVKREGIANFTREVDVRSNLSQAMNENVDLSTKLSNADKSIRLLSESNAENERKIKELNQEHDICMQDKDETQKSLSNAKKQVNGLQKNFDLCKDDIERQKVKIKELENDKSKLTEDIKDADQRVNILDTKLKGYKTELESVKAQREKVNNELSKTNIVLTQCKTDNKQHEKTIANLTTQLSTCHNDLTVSNRNLQVAETTIKDLESKKNTLGKDLKDTRFSLGNCKNKNMDHEVQNLELLQEIESLKKELKAC